MRHAILAMTIFTLSACAGTEAGGDASEKEIRRADFGDPPTEAECYALAREIAVAVRHAAGVYAAAIPSEAAATRDRAVRSAEAYYCDCLAIVRAADPTETDRGCDDETGD